MPDADDRLRDALEGAARLVEPDGVLEAVARRRARRRTVRRVQLAAAPLLAVALIAGRPTATGDDDSRPTGVAAGPDDDSEPVTTTEAVQTTTTAEDAPGRTRLSAGETPATKPQTKPTTTLGPSTRRRGGILFASDRGGQGGPSHFIMDPDGSDVRPLPGIKGQGCDWMPRGDELICAEPVSSDWVAPANISRVRPDGTGKRFLFRRPTARPPAVSPDGRLLAYVRNENDHFGPVTIVGLDGIERSHFVETASVYGPSWSPDGKEVAFIRNGVELMVGDVVTGLVRAMDTGDLQPNEVAWSPDGERMALVALEGVGTDVYLFELATQKVTHIPGHAQLDDHPSWSPDGSKLAFRSGYTPINSPHGGPYNPPEHDIWVYDVRRGTDVQITSRPGSDADPVWGSTPRPTFGCT